MQIGFSSALGSCRCRSSDTTLSFLIHVVAAVSSPCSPPPIVGPCCMHRAPCPCLHLADLWEMTWAAWLVRAGALWVGHLGNKGLSAGKLALWLLHGLSVLVPCSHVESSGLVFESIYQKFCLHSSCVNCSKGISKA